MATSYLATVGTTDYGFDWVSENIEIENLTTAVSANDLKLACREAEASVVGIVFPQIATTYNPVQLTPTTSTFLSLVLADAWKVLSLSGSGVLVVGDGNVVGDVDGIDIFAPNGNVTYVNNTSASGVLVTTGSGVTQQDKDDIEAQIFARAVEGGFSFEEMMRLIGASAAGTIEQATDGSYTIRGVDGTTARVLGELAANNGRNVTGTDAT
jgi:hypothetical protein